MELQLFCMDASSAAAGSEDWGLSRLAFQRELAVSLSRSCLLAASGGGASGWGRPRSAISSGGHPATQVAALASSGGKARVLLHPTPEIMALGPALAAVSQGEGGADLAALLKLALLVSRRFSRVRVTAFVASPPALPPPAAAQLRQRLQEEWAAGGGVRLELAVLCSREELGQASVAALEELASAPEARLAWAAPSHTATEDWQQLELALEALETCSASTDTAAVPPLEAAAAAPLLADSEAWRHPARRQPSSTAHRPEGPRGVALLAARSGVNQPAMCRHESLDWMGHLSSDGMLRSWLPTYSSIAQKARNAAAAGGAAGAPAGEQCYVQVQPIPRWRTLLRVAAAPLVAEPLPGASAQSSGSASSSDGASFAQRAAEPLPGASAPSGGSGASSSDRASLVQRAAELLEELSASRGGAFASSSDPQRGQRYTPAPGRGTLRLLQGIKEPSLLKLVWSADATPAGAGGAASVAAQPAAFNMFAPPGSSGNSGASMGGGASAAASCLGYMPAEAVAASAARGPLLHEGCELWEGTAGHDLELSLALGPASSKAAASIEAHAAPNGAQVLFVCTGAGRRRRAEAFYLQQRWGADSWQAPVYATLPPRQHTEQEEEGEEQQVAQPACAAGALSEQLPAAAAGPGAGAAPEAEAAAAEGAAAGPGAEAAPAAEAAAVEGAAALAAQLQGLLARPPGVDMRRVRRDVKEGTLLITPITVGPLPATLLRDIVRARAAMMNSLSVENLDSWEGGSTGGGTARPGSGTGAALGTAGAGASAVPSSTAGTAGSGGEQRPGGAPGEATGASAVAAAAAAGGGEAPRRPALPHSEARAVMQRHKAAMLCLLRQRLPRGGTPDRSGSGGSSSGRGEGAEEECSTPPSARQPAEGGEAGSVSTPLGSYTPYGTPMHVLPSGLMRRCAAEGEEAAAPEGGGEASHADASQPAAGPGAAVVLTTAAAETSQQADAGGADPATMFEFES